LRKIIHVIHNFIDINRFYQSDKDHFKKMLAPNGERILAHVSNFRKVKRVEDVIHVFQKVREKMPCKLLMIGDGPERPNAEELSRSLEVCNDIRFLGKQEQMDEILSISDLFHTNFFLRKFWLVGLGSHVLWCACYFYQCRWLRRN